MQAAALRNYDLLHARLLPVPTNCIVSFCLSVSSFVCLSPYETRTQKKHKKAIFSKIKKFNNLELRSLLTTYRSPMWGFQGPILGP